MKTNPSLAAEGAPMPVNLIAPNVREAGEQIADACREVHNRLSDISRQAAAAISARLANIGGVREKLKQNPSKIVRTAARFATISAGVTLGIMGSRLLGTAEAFADVIPGLEGIDAPSGNMAESDSAGMILTGHDMGGSGSEWGGHAEPGDINDVLGSSTPSPSASNLTSLKLPMGWGEGSTAPTENIHPVDHIVDQATAHPMVGGTPDTSDHLTATTAAHEAAAGTAAAATVVGSTAHITNGYEADLGHYGTPDQSGLRPGTLAWHMHAALDKQGVHLTNHDNWIATQRFMELHHITPEQARHFGDNYHVNFSSDDLQTVTKGLTEHADKVTDVPGSTANNNVDQPAHSTPHLTPEQQHALEGQEGMGDTGSTDSDQTVPGAVITPTASASASAVASATAAAHSASPSAATSVASSSQPAMAVPQTPPSQETSDSVSKGLIIGGAAGLIAATGAGLYLRNKRKGAPKVKPYKAPRIKSPKTSWKPKNVLAGLAGAAAAGKDAVGRGFSRLSQAGGDKNPAIYADDGADDDMPTVVFSGSTAPSVRPQAVPTAPPIRRATPQPPEEAIPPAARLLPPRQAEPFDDGGAVVGGAGSTAAPRYLDDDDEPPFNPNR